jgi:RNA-directed DNA polymerase
MSGVSENAESRGGGDIVYERLISRENLFSSWKKFSCGKMRQQAVQKFWLQLENELFSLYHDLKLGKYCHGIYTYLVLHDTKRRDIYVAPVRDRVVHALVAGYLERVFSPRMFAQSFAAQKGKGVDAARAYLFGAMQSLRRRGDVWVLKLDVRKYFANIDHTILKKCLGRRITDHRIMGLCEEIIRSFGDNERGIPLGNLTSQWFANIYLHELDQFAKHALGILHYMRYNDDVIVLGTDEGKLVRWVEALVNFATEKLQLCIPPNKQSITRLPNTVDVLGVCTDGTRKWLRPATKARALQSIFYKQQQESPSLFDTLCSYSGIGIYESFEV